MRLSRSRQAAVLAIAVATGSTIALTNSWADTAPVIAATTPADAGAAVEEEPEIDATTALPLGAPPAAEPEPAAAPSATAEPETSALPVPEPETSALPVPEPETSALPVPEPVEVIADEAPENKSGHYTCQGELYSETCERTTTVDPGPVAGDIDQAATASGQDPVYAQRIRDEYCASFPYVADCDPTSPWNRD